MKDDEKIEKEAVEQAYREQCEEALRTETPPVYVDEDSCPMAAHMLSLLNEADEDGNTEYIDESGNPIDPSELDPSEWVEVDDEEDE